MKKMRKGRRKRRIALKERRIADSGKGEKQK